VQANYKGWGCTVKADSHIPCRSTAMPRICLSESDPSRLWQGHDRVTAWERHAMCELASASKDGMLATCQSSAYSWYHAEFQEVCYQKHTKLICRWPVWNKATFVMDEKKLINLVKGHEYLYNLHHKDYDDNLEKDNSWKKDSRTSCTKLGTFTKDTALSRNCRVVAGELHCMCESALRINLCPYRTINFTRFCNTKKQVTCGTYLFLRGSSPNPPYSAWFCKRNKTERP
jgi:hypothetical protein